MASHLGLHCMIWPVCSNTKHNFGMQYADWSKAAIDILLSDCHKVFIIIYVSLWGLIIQSNLVLQQNLRVRFCTNETSLA